jgi:Protein NO VEIN, C-terminal
MKYVIITENDESQWDDRTGVSYNYPSRYSRILTPGTRVIYYKGKLREKRFEDLRLSKEPHYFGVAIIGDNYLDENASKKEFYCDILTYQPFDLAIPFKVNGDYLESIPESKKSNYWRDGVREITKESFDKILELASVEFEYSTEICDFRISLRKFGEVFEQFPSFVLDESGGESFVGFSNGYLHESESYKEELREESLTILKTTEWGNDWIGKGEILRRIIQSFELEMNNLVDTRRKYGPDSVPHSKMIQAIDDGTNIAIIEQTIFDLFRSRKEQGNIFNQLVNLIGKQYSVIAFLFFLKNDRQYLPISTTNFEYAFKTLGCDLTLSRNCSWDNYKSYLRIIFQVKDALEVSMNQNINLIDAHSFCWLLGYKNRYQEWLREKALPKTQLVFNAFEINPVNNSSNQKRSTPNETNRDGNVDWDKENKRKRIKGRRAEELVMDFERQRLLEAGKEDLLAKVEDYSTKYSKGFDVLSWNVDGTERNIEVKSSNNNGFILTRNELNKSETNPNYWIYIVNENKHEIQIKQIKAPSLRDQGQFRLEPKDYYVSFSIDDN